MYNICYNCILVLCCYVIYILSVQFVVVLVYSLTWICVHVCERELGCVVCEPTSMNVHPAHMIEPFLGGREMFVRARASHMCNVCATMFVRARASRIWAHTHIHLYIYTIHTHTHTHTHIAAVAWARVHPRPQGNCRMATRRRCGPAPCCLITRVPTDICTDVLYPERPARAV